MFNKTLSKSYLQRSLILSKFKINNSILKYDKSFSNQNFNEDSKQNNDEFNYYKNKINDLNLKSSKTNRTNQNFNKFDQINNQNKYDQINNQNKYDQINNQNKYDQINNQNKYDQINNQNKFNEFTKISSNNQFKESINNNQILSSNNKQFEESINSKISSDNKFEESINNDKIYELNTLSSNEQLINIDKIDTIDYEISNLNPNSKNIDKEFMETIKPDLPATFNLATYANHLDIIKQLVKLNVLIYKLEEDRELAKYLITLNFDEDVKPYLNFLIKCGLEKDDLGRFLTLNFKILQENLINLEKRIEYYRRMNFKDDEILKMMLDYPKFINYSIDYVDDRLGGHLQGFFGIKPLFVRQMLINYPRLLKENKLAFESKRFALIEECGFKNYQMKHILITSTQLIGKDNRRITGSFEYIWNNITKDRELICKFADVLNVPVRILHERDQYLKKLGRAKYNPLKPLYVPLSAFSIDDKEFLEYYCKTDENDFYKFIKSF